MVRYFLFWSSFIILLLTEVDISAQISSSKTINYSIENWDSFSGLETNLIRSITKTDDGFLLIGTMDGLISFDGLTFRKVHNNQIGISDQVYNLFKEKSGRIWIYTNHGLYTYYNDIFTTIFLDELTARCFITAKSKNSTAVIYKNQAKLYEDGIEISTSDLQMKNDYFSALYYNNDLIVEHNNSLFKADKKNSPILTNIDISYLIHSNESGLYFSNEDKQLFKLDNGNILSDSICDLINSIHYIAFKKFDDYLYCTTPNELILIDDLGTHKIATSNYFNPEKINSVYRDEDQSYWVGTETNGMYRIKRNPLIIISEKDGLSNGLISSVYKKEDKLFIGYNCGGIETYTSDTIERFNYNGNGCVWSISSADSNIWIGTYNGGIIKANSTGDDRVLPESIICKALFTDSKNNVWIGTDKGIFLSEKGNIKLIQELNESPFCIFELPNGNILIGAINGYYIVERGVCTFHELTDKIENKLVIFSFEHAEENDFWIGTNRGLFLNRDNQYINFSDALPEMGKKIYSLTKDVHENLWISGNKGLNIIEKKELEGYIEKRENFIHFYSISKNEGLMTSTFFGGAQNSLAKLSDSKYVYASLDGLVFVDHSELVFLKKYPTKIVSIYANNISISGNQFSMQYGAYPIEINFTTPAYLHPENIIYEYRINEETWQNLGTKRTLLLSNLSPGKYQIQVRSSCSSSGVKINFEIIPLYYQTIWFKLGISFGSLLIILSVILLIIKNIKKKEKAKRNINEKIAELEIKAFQSKLNPHFIFNCLNSIQSLFLSGDDLKANKYLNNFSSLMRKVLDSSDKIYITIEEEVQTLVHYLSLEQLQFDQGLVYKFEYSESINVERDLIPANILQPFIENSLKHGISKIKNVGIIKILFSKENNQFTISIIDNGIGIEEANNIKKDSNLGHESKGMKIVHERLEVLRSAYNLPIQLTIQNPSEPLDENTGTLILIKFDLIKQ